MPKLHCVLSLVAIVILDLAASPDGHGCCESFMNHLSLWMKGRRSDICQTNAFRIKKFPDWTFSDSLLLSSGFPIDPELRNYARQVRNVAFSIVEPTPLKTKARIVALSEEVLIEILDLNATDCEHSTEFLNFVAGNQILKDSTSLAHRYGGHQFGEWAEQLGDGRAHLLGEYVNQRGERWELQLKGSGKTPYSRHGDGRAVLRSSVREFLCSEAFHYLQIPTSRAAALIVSNDPVIRDQFYNGNVQTERAAVVLRVAPSWFRIGSLEILEQSSEVKLLRHLVDFIIKNLFKTQVDNSSKDKYVEFFKVVFSQTILTVVKWMGVGFAHGVCNTDNFSILGITIDYGPFGFVEEYDPNFIPNTSDDEGRYRLENQPTVAKFNLDKLRITLNPLINEKGRKKLKNILKTFEDVYQNSINDEFREKLGLFNHNDDDKLIVASLLFLMKETKSDFTMTFRELSELPIQKFFSNSTPKSMWALKILSQHKYFEKWIESYRLRLLKNPKNITDDVRMARMQKKNPCYVLKNWMAEQAIRKANSNDFSQVGELLKILRNPYLRQITAEEAGYADRRPSWADDIKVSCSS